MTRDKSDEWTDVIQTVSARHRRGEITGAEYGAFTEWVDEARKRGWTPECMDFDPESFEDRLEEVTHQREGLVRLNAPHVPAPEGYA